MAKSNNYEKYKYLIGTKINKWTILDIIIYENKHHTYVLAKCDCGTIKEVRLSYIINNKIKDCGCEHQKRLNEAAKKKYEHLINTIINGWTILDIIPPNGKYSHTLAICQCQCGEIKEVRLSYVINGRSKDCGCGRKEMLRETRTKNLVGQKFGKLTVVELLEDSNKFGRRVYKCKCDCGNEINVPSNSLIEYHTLSCGCLKSQWNMYINQLLTKKEIEHQCEYAIYIDDKHYWFDFYLPQYNLFIEYDGEQHFYPVSFGADEFTTQKNFELIQKRDKIKDEYCNENGINLLRIPYWEKDNIETIINNCLQRLNEKDLAYAV